MPRTCQREREGGRRRILRQCPVASAREICVRTCGAVSAQVFPDVPACMCVFGRSLGAGMLSCVRTQT
eukprot:14661259-Alexandrium_andersonii.AAC.1